MKVAARRWELIVALVIAALGGVIVLNAAVTDSTSFIVTRHDPVLLVQAPDQPAKADFDPGVAVSVTTVPEA